MTYESAVLADSPGWFWKLAESSGTAAADDSGNGNAGTYNQTAPGGFTLGQTGAPGVFTTAVLLSAASSGQVFSASTFTHNFPISCDIWFKTTSATGGGLIAFGDTTFVIWVQDNGKAAIGAYDGSNFNFAASTAAYNDGAWHYMGGAYDNSTTTATLVVDGTQVASVSSSTIAAGDQSWHVGFGDFLNGIPGTSGNFFTGTVSAPAYYPTALTVTKMAAHYAAASGSTTHNGAAALTGSGTLTAGAQKNVPGAAALTGSGTLTAAGQKTVPGAAAMSGSGTLTATATTSGQHAGAAALSGQGTLTAAGTKQVHAAASLTGTGTFGATGSKSVPGAAVLTGTGTFTAAGVKLVPGAAVLAGSGTLTAAARKTLLAAVALSGHGTLTAAPVPRSGGGVLMAASIV